jgi:hypothetical protein
MTKPEARNPNQIRMMKSERALTENKRVMAISRLDLRKSAQSVDDSLRRAKGVMSDHNARAKEPEIFSLRSWRIRGLEQERI